MHEQPTAITSRDNPLIKRLRTLAQDNSAYRKQGAVWLEGDHLCRALVGRGLQPECALFSHSHWPQAAVDLKQAAPVNYLVPDALMASISGLESPAGVGFLWPFTAATDTRQRAPTVVLDRLQDAGNVGSILRSAAALGFAQVVALKGTVALWSPKVLRAGMGAHFGLHLVEGWAESDLSTLQLPLLVTSSHRGTPLHDTHLPWPCAWVFGHEGQGASTSLDAVAQIHVRIAQPGGEESLNVAAAAAICLHASAVANTERRAR